MLFGPYHINKIFRLLCPEPSARTGPAENAIGDKAADQNADNEKSKRHADCGDKAYWLVLDRRVIDIFLHFFYLHLKYSTGIPSRSASAISAVTPTLVCHPSRVNKKTFQQTLRKVKS